MTRNALVLCAALFVLAACGDSHRVTYSGHEESTEGVPGYVNGKKVAPTIKLGQSYSVDGETFVPRNQPSYVEEGLASWYGPGFHGGKTANGERFDKDELTGAHRTLPLPSIVRVTMLSTGKQVFVRINDRGPFAKSRIIDLSRAAADKIGLLRAGVAKVRVEYMPKESQRFADLLGQGRDPKSIDLASEVLNYASSDTEIARGAIGETHLSENATVRDDPNSGSFWDRFSSTPQSQPNGTVNAAPLSDVSSAELPQPAPASKIMEADKVPAVPATLPEATGAVASEDDSPFNVLNSAAGEGAPAAKASPAIVASAAPAAPMSSTLPITGKIYVQLGAFSNAANAERVRQQFASVSNLEIAKKDNAAGQTLYRVRMGPYTTAEASNAALAKAREAGANATLIRE